VIQIVQSIHLFGPLFFSAISSNAPVQRKMISASLLYTQQSLGGGKEIINIFHNLAKKEKKLFLKLDSLAQKRERRVFFSKHI
jgi:hypothetical protein